MVEVARQFNINLDILKQCREQMGLSQEEVSRKVNSISKIEQGEKRPTYKQLDTLSDLYHVPRWVFIADQLLEEYQYTKTPAFRKFKDSSIFEDSKVRKLISRVEEYRNIFIELRNDLDDPIQQFSPPVIEESQSIKSIASTVRQWLSMHNEKYYDFANLKQRLEQKNVFIFLTSKYKGWSHIDKSFRGLCIYHQTLPVIIINDSDSRKAQSFTLMHELGHLLRSNTAIDGDDMASSGTERWCDAIAGEVLMPTTDKSLNSFSANDLPNIKILAAKFKVSPNACLVRLRQLRKINQKTYDEHENTLTQEYEQLQIKLKNSEGGPSRNRPNEVQIQFGTPFTNTVLTAYQNKEITLHKVARLLGLQRTKHIFDLRNIL